VKKVLLIQEVIPHYRVPIFNELAKKVDLTIIYSKGELPENVSFKTRYVPIVKYHYVIHKENICKIAKEYDVVICTFNFSYLYSRLLYILPHKYKLIFWGIGVAADYNKRYDSDQKIANSLCKAIKSADAAVFYSEYPVKKYSKMGIDEGKLFVANNTVKVFESEPKDKSLILFIGSLYKAKKIDYLLENYEKAYLKYNDIPNLVIIGNGEEYDNIIKWCQTKKLSYKIKLCGSITDDYILSDYFSRAIICISPDQAGLSVLKSMGNGVPYVTHRNAITGGEIFNIKSGENGILIDDFEEIEKIILDCVYNKENFIQMGQNAKKHYEDNRTVEHMVQGFLDAINYVCNDK